MSYDYNPLIFRSARRLMLGSLFSARFPVLCSFYANFMAEHCSFRLELFHVQFIPKCRKQCEHYYSFIMMDKGLGVVVGVEGFLFNQSINQSSEIRRHISVTPEYFVNVLIYCRHAFFNGVLRIFYLRWKCNNDKLKFL